MLEKFGRTFEDIIDDLGYFLKRSTAFIVGKAGGEVAGVGVALAAGPLLATIAGFAGIDGAELAKGSGFATAIATTLAAGVVAGVSGGLVQADFKHRRAQLVERYREEAGAKLQKAPDKITEQDIEVLARGDFKRGIEANPAIRQELKNSWLERNVGVILSAVVAAATFMIIKTFDPSGLHDIIPHGSNLFTAITGAVAQGDVGLLGDFAMKLGLNGLAGFATYHAIKTPLHIAASEVLGIEENTVNERITDIKRGLGHGHQIQPEQVLGVFIQAHQDVAEQMKADYGKSYDKMNAVERGQIVSMMQQYMDIEGLARDINSGRMRPEELAFTTFGQQSGIGKAEDGTHKHRGNVFDGMWKGLSAITGGFTTHARQTSHKEMSGYVGDLPGKTTYSIQTPSANEASMQMHNEQEDAGMKQNFVARVGRKVEDNGVSHVERLSQSSAQELVLNR